MRRVALAAALLLAASAGLAGAAAPQIEVPQPGRAAPSGAAVPAASPAEGFATWLQAYHAGAVARGLQAGWLDAALAEARYLPRVVELDRAQPDDSGRANVFADYLARQLTARRIEDGRTRMLANVDALGRASAATGVPTEIILAIWGMETSYGRVMGGFDLPSAIATLAYDGRRAALFTRELDALVRMVGERGVARSDLVGSWAGAFGQGQFLPSSYLAHARDGDGDGRADIWRSAPDTFASIGGYLRDKGWVAGSGWGFRVGLPIGFDRASVANPVEPVACIRPLKRHSRWQTVAQWRALGFVPLNAAWPADSQEMSLVEPDGEGQGAYLTTRNYRAIMEYNCSNFYALSVALLADAVR